MICVVQLGSSPSRGRQSQGWSKSNLSELALCSICTESKLSDLISRLFLLVRLEWSSDENQPFFLNKRVSSLSLVIFKILKGYARMNPQVAHWQRTRLPVQETRDVGLIPGLGRSPGGGNGNPLQYSCLGNSTDRGAWRATVHGVVKSQIQLSE